MSWMSAIDEVRQESATVEQFRSKLTEFFRANHRPDLADSPQTLDHLCADFACSMFRPLRKMDGSYTDHCQDCGQTEEEH
jgi:hypothetical protein